MSASRVWAARSVVRECATVTVALAACNISAIGCPTRMLRPMTTARWPAGSMTAVAQKRHHPGRCAAARAGFAFQQPSQIEGVQTVSIFRRIDGLQQGTLIQPLRQRQLKQDSIDAGIRIQRFDRAEHLISWGFGRQMSSKTGNTHAGASFFFVGDVNRTGWSSPTRRTASPGGRPTSPVKASTTLFEATLHR